MKRLLKPAVSALLLATFSTACLVPQSNPPVIASAQVVPDFTTYSLRRVGLVPFQGTDLGNEQSYVLQNAFFTEVSRATSFEVVPLDAVDLEEVPTSDPYRRGHYKPRTVLDLAHRFNLDGVLVGTVTGFKPYPPLALSVQLDLVASETGQVIWSSSVHLDARDDRVREGIRKMYAQSGPAGDEGWEVALLSPSRFSAYAAYQIAQLL